MLSLEVHTSNDGFLSTRFRQPGKAWNRFILHSCLWWGNWSVSSEHVALHKLHVCRQPFMVSQNLDLINLSRLLFREFVCLLAHCLGISCILSGSYRCACARKKRLCLWLCIQAGWRPLTWNCCDCSSKKVVFRNTVREIPKNRRVSTRRSAPNKAIRDQWLLHSFNRL